MSAEIAPDLTAMLGAPDAPDWLDVVLELMPARIKPGTDRRRTIEAARSNFERLSEPIKRAVVAAGGVVEGEAWMNSTLKCRIPTAALSEMRRVAGVQRIDLPHVLSTDSEPSA